MTREEYTEARDVFHVALRAVEDACEVFYELALDHLGSDAPSHAWDVSRALQENGSWISGELEALLDAQAELEKLVGRAHARATSLPEVAVTRTPSTEGRSL